MKRRPTKMMVLAAVAGAVAAVGVGVAAAAALLTDGRSSPSSAVTIRGTITSSSYQVAFHIEGNHVCMRLRFTRGRSGDEASSDGCSAVHGVPVGLQHAMCDSRYVFIYGAAPQTGRLAVSRGGTLRTRRLGSVRAYVVALSAQQLPTRFEYSGAAGGRRPWSITIPALSTACRAQSGIKHPTDTVGYLN